MGGDTGREGAQDWRGHRTRVRAPHQPPWVEELADRAAFSGSFRPSSHGQD